MDNDPFASRVAARLKWPIALVGAGSAMTALSNLLNWASDRVTTYAAVVVAVAATGMFLCAVFDMRLQRAVLHLNADRRAEAKRLGWLTRLTGIGLPAGDRVLLALSVALLAITVFAGNGPHRLPPAALGFAGFFLVTVAQIALMARGQPTDRFAPPFT
jgi:hypothetical protein